MSTLTLLKSRLWNGFQAVIGTNSQKRSFLRKAIRGTGRVLEIGCATGNIAQIFVESDYLGVDTDVRAIELAAVNYRHRPNMKFVAGDLFDLNLKEGEFDYVVISHTAHHIPDKPMLALLQHSHGLLRDDGTLVILDMVRPEPSEPFRRQFYYRIDQGEHFRTVPEFDALLSHGGLFSEVQTEVLECRKFGIRVIDQILIEAKKARA